MQLKQLKITWNKKRKKTLHLERYYYILHTKKIEKHSSYLQPNIYIYIYHHS